MVCVTTDVAVRTADHLRTTEAALAEQFPDVPRTLLHDLVMAAYRSLEDARISDFLPVLVWRIVRDQLRDQLPAARRQLGFS